MITERWLRVYLRPIIVALMAACVVQSFVGLAVLLRPGWNGEYLVAFAVLVTLESFYSYTLIRSSRIMQLTGAWKYRLAEFLILFTLLQIVANMNARRLNILADIPSFEPPVLLASGMLLGVWLIAKWTADDLTLLGEDPERNHEYVPPADRLSHRFLMGGVMLIAVSGVTRLGMAGLISGSRSPVSGLVVNALLYFVLGVIMLGQIRYTALNTQWRLRGANVSEGLSRSWVRQSVVFLALTAFVALLLPTRYTVGLLELLGYIFSVFLWIVLIFWTLLLIPFGWLMSLLGTGSTEGQQQSMPPPPVQPPNSDSGGSWFGLFQSFMFWVVVVLVAGYLVRAFLRKNPHLLNELGRVRPLQVLGRLLLALWRRLTHYAATAAALVRHGASARPNLGVGVFGPRRRRPANTPRDRVIEVYRSTVEFAGERGYRRGRGETPNEFDQTLSPHLREAGPQMRDLTDVFERARYSPHDIEPQQAGSAHTDAERVEAELEAIRKEREERARARRKDGDPGAVG